MTHTPEEKVSDDAGETGVPLLRTWGAVYAFVLIAFIAYVVALWLFTRSYS